MRKKIFWLNCFVVIAIACNLRAPLTSIGPIIEVIKEHYYLSSAMAGLLTSLPLIAFGSISFVVAYFPPVATLMGGILLILCGEILRSVGGEIGLFVGMALLGTGIAIANVLLPSFIKQKFPTKTTQMMSVYSLVLNTSAVAGIGLSFPLLSYFSLQYALLFWIVFAFLALLAYFPQIRNGRIFHARKKSAHTPNLFIHKSAWIITCFFGLQSFIAYSMFAWLATIIADRGYTQQFGIDILLLTQFVAIPVALFGPLLLGRMRKMYQAPYIACLCLCYIVAYLLLLGFDSVTIVYISAILIGIPMGGVFGIALLFISLKSENAFIAAKLSSMSQGFGYLIASSAPFILGYLHDYFGEFRQALVMLLCVSCLVSIVALLAYKSPIITAKHL
ncbi:MFS transporter [Helicobacter aurati]|uniref:MFS transporter n=1 Tax=Helicobacter aurati TaxID=137778 RepID=A0A3D8J2J0_9HELI|nr:MFS transporter [Helicobacter aurati]RDU71074.1 MFS transporter [Helicobacter aurati]